MRYCPKCGERFSEDIIKFCTRDGTPLVEEGEPRFTAMPSQGVEDDIGDETVIRRRPFDEAAASGPEGPERFVIPTASPEEREPVRRPHQAYYPPPPQQQNTGKVVVLTILGTIFVLACGAGLFWLLQGERPANVNVNNINTNMPNINLNANANRFDTNFNFNMNSVQMPNINTNFNFNLNANLKPTPSPRPTPTPRPSPSPSPFVEPSPRPPVNAPPASTPRTVTRPPTMSNRPSNGT